MANIFLQINQDGDCLFIYILYSIEVTSLKVENVLFDKKVFKLTKLTGEKTKEKVVEHLVIMYLEK